MISNRRILRTCLTAVCLVFYPGLSSFLSGQSRALRFDHLAVEDGLSKEAIISIYQDKDGFMWFGSQGGIDRYDGQRIVSFYNRLSDSTLKYEQITVAICEDSYDGLWFGNDTNGLVLFNKKTEKIRRFGFNPKNTKGLSSGNVRAILEDTGKNLWIATYDGGLNLFNRQDSTFTHFKHDPADSNSIASNNLTSIAEDREGKIWLASGEGYLCNYDRDTKKFRNIRISRGMGFFMKPVLHPQITIGSDHIIWIANGPGLSRYDPVDGSIRFIPMTDQSGKMVFSLVISILEYGKNQIMVSTYGNGLFLLDTKTFKTINYTHSAYDAKGLNSNWLSQLCKSRDEVIWIGSHLNGINKYDRMSRRFQQLEDLVGLKYLEESGNSFLNLCEAPDGKIWLGSANNGVFVYDPPNGTIKSLSPLLERTNVFGMAKDRKNNIWMAFFINGYMMYDWNTGKLRTPSSIPGINMPPVRMSLSKILSDSKGRLWLGYIENGIDLYDPVNKTTSHFVSRAGDNSSLYANDIYKIFEDRQGHIWVGTGHGLNRYDPEKKSFERIPVKDENGNDAHVTVFEIFQDSRDRIWVGTYKTLHLYDPAEGTFKNYPARRKNNLVTAFAMVEDRNHFLWISTDAGIQKFNPETGIFTDLSASDNTRYISYHPSSGLITRDGIICFGSSKGLTLFRPENIQENPYIPPVFITGLRIDGIPVTTEKKNTILKQSIQHTRSVRLNFRQTDIAIEFSALSYSNPERNQFAYRLENYDREWIMAGNSGIAEYKNLPHGHYIFQVKASNNHGIWNDQPALLRIYIRSPFWKTWWFYTLAVLLTVGILRLYYLNRVIALKRQKMLLEQQVKEHTKELNEANLTLKEQHEELMQQHDEIAQQNERLSQMSEEILLKNSELEQHQSNLEQMVTDRTRELMEARFKAEESDRLKSAFLANMSHEIRTPMNAIVGFANLLKEEKLPEGERNEFIDIINSNSEILLVLIDDILDLSLIEANQVIIRKEIINLNEILDNLFSAFSLMNKKEMLVIKLSNDIHSLNLRIHTDRIRLKQILTNLMNNAYKFTDRGSVELGAQMTDNKDLAIYVRDTGIGINENDLPYIFDRFRKSDMKKATLYRGTGLGLAISKALSQILGGGLTVKSRVGEGSEFTLVLPRELITAEETTVNTILPRTDGEKWDGKNILIVEDEQANYLYVKKLLGKTGVGIHWAENGLEAVKTIASGKPFDLVLMDIKMPVMDGYEATKIIKANYPAQVVVALTAYARPEDRLQFIGAGFDDYLTKPIKPGDLLAIISRFMKV